MLLKSVRRSEIPTSTHGPFCVAPQATSTDRADRGSRNPSSMKCAPFMFLTCPPRAHDAMGGGFMPVRRFQDLSQDVKVLLLARQPAALSNEPECLLHEQPQDLREISNLKIAWMEATARDPRPHGSMYSLILLQKSSVLSHGLQSFENRAVSSCDSERNFDSYSTSMFTNN
jgi:hypothetical protein